LSLLGLSEQHISGDDEEEEEEEEPQATDGSDGKVEALFSQIHPQLCAGLFSLLEEVLDLSADSAGSSGGYWAGRNALLVVEVVDGLCGVLCSLIDSSHPCQCPTSTLHRCCERVVSILSTAPHGSHVAQVVAVATAIVRQSSDCSGAPTEDLYRLPFLCLRRSLQILHQSSLYLQDRDGDRDGDGSGEDSQGEGSCDLLIVLESLRLVRQCCVAHPEVLSETGRFNSDPASEGAGNLFFECFSCLLKSPRVIRNGALVRMMNTALSCFSDDGGRYKGRKAGAVRTVLTRTNYLPSFMRHLGPLLCTLLSLGLFDEQERALRTFSGYIENLLNLYRTNRGTAAVSNGVDGNFSGMLEHVCGQISQQVDAVSSSNSTFNTVLRIPAISSNIVMVSASAYLKVVYLTLTACVQDTKQAASTRQSYMELCLLYRVGRITAQAIQTADASADVERRGEILRSVPESVCKLVIWPLGEF
jgi:hypothetical protein